MTNDNLAATPSRDSNPDPITGAPGSHPIGTGVGSAGAGLAGAAIGTMVGGPVGGLVGAAIGAIAGGIGGHAIAENIDPTIEDAYWLEAHGRQPYAKGSTYDSYAPAYRNGYEGYAKHGATRKSFGETELELRNSYQEMNTTVSWEEAREASRAAWRRVEHPSPTFVQKT